jgi:hypothetical protein
MLLPIVADMKLDRSPGAVAIQKVIYAAFGIHDQRHGQPHQVQRLAKVLLDEVFPAKSARWVSLMESRED